MYELRFLSTIKLKNRCLKVYNHPRFSWYGPRKQENDVVGKTFIEGRYGPVYSIKCMGSFGDYAFNFIETGFYPFMQIRHSNNAIL